MKKWNDFERMNPIERRRFLKTIGIVLASPLIPSHIRFACNEILMGEAHAQTVEQNVPTYFIEVNLRDQWDFGHAIVAPGLATYSNLSRGDKGKKVALFQDPQTLKKSGTFYLTQEGSSLLPHLDTVAVLELCEIGMGTVHNHEAANAIRSPGRSYTGGVGRSPMWLLDPHAKTQGNENHYSSTPTPAVLHNYHQRQFASDLRRGVAYKGISRDIHTVYHFAADLNDAQLDRFQSTESLVDSFANTSSASTGILSSHADAITRLLKRVDQKFLDQLRFGSQAKNDHGAQVDGFRKRLNNKSTFDLKLTQSEIDFWSQDVPHDGHEGPKAQIWEQMAFAAKMVTNDLVRSVALEFDYVDVHGSRPESVLRAQGLQTAVPLARLIQTLKNAGIYDRSLIALYTTDGGRSPASESWGTEGKNGVILAGGRIRGGYYGDIRVVGGTSDGGHVFRYYKPDETTGNPVVNGTNGNDRRISGASIWKTIAKANRIPAQLYDSFPDVKNAQELNFLLNGS